MISEIKIENYKSIRQLDFKLGRINVLIGENGAGKSNILEAIALAGAATSEKLDNEFLTSRGIRVTQPEFMRPAFPGSSISAPILIEAKSDKEGSISLEINNDNQPYSKWQVDFTAKTSDGTDFFSFIELLISLTKEQKNRSNSKEDVVKIFNDILKQIPTVSTELGDDESLLKNDKSQPNKTVALKLDDGSAFARHVEERKIKSTDLASSLRQFIIYSPENSALRTFQREGQIEPLGINGEGLLRLLSVLHSEKQYKDVYSGIRQSLKLLGWFDDFEIVDDATKLVSRIEIKDRYLDSARRYFDQMSTNEGFLYLVFYFALFSCDLTPRFFAIDNIDASLNPKLCDLMIKELAKISVMHDKQVILTTHNPAVLDGLNLDDDQQRLFVVSRNRHGHTRLKRVLKQSKSEYPIRLSEAFLNGALGGLPTGF